MDHTEKEPQAPLPLRITGVLFLIIGVINLLGTIAIWEYSHQRAWGTLVYMLLNATFALGLLRAHGWVLIGAILNFCNIFFLTVPRLFLHPHLLSSTSYLIHQGIAVALNAGVCALIYTYRSHLHKDAGAVVGALFLLFWFGLLCYTASSL